MSESIKVYNAALDEEDGEIILRGVLDPDVLHLLNVDEYQREVAPLATINKLVEGFKRGSIPDIELGMRGQHCLERGGCFYLQDPVYIVDGLQRVSAAIHLLKMGGERKPRLGASVHFGTTEKWERERFNILNAERIRLSSNVLLRNLRHDYAVVKLLYQLTSDRAFILHDRICWSQRMRRQDLVTAMTFFKTVGALHAHIGPGRSSRYDELARGLETIMGRTGRNIFRDNARTFFDIVDQCWGIRRIAFKEGAAYMRANFLDCLASAFSRHTDFWRENRLFVEAPLVRKIALFPVSDPQISNLASASGKARDLLYLLMVDHINSGKRTRRLKSRNDVEPIEVEEELGEVGVEIFATS